MTRSLSIFALAIVLMSLERAAPGQDQIAWTNNLRQAQDAAARDGKLILVHFYSDNCPPCKALERNVFPRPEIVAAIHRNYVPVKVHVDSAPQLAGRFRVESWPTDLILTHAGLEVSRKVSPQTPAEYVSFLDQEAFQAGVGAGRLNDNSFIADRSGLQQRGNVALTAAAVPHPGGTLGGPAAGTATGSTAPARTAPYDPREGAAAPAQGPPTGNPHTGAPANQQRYSQPGIPQQPATAAAPNTTAFLQAAANRAPAATPSPARSIYDDPPEQAAAPPPSIYAPQQPVAPGVNRPQAGPAPGVYDPPVSRQPTAQQPQLPAPSSQQWPDQQRSAAQQAGAQFRSPQSIPIDKAPPLAIDGFCPVTILESKRWHKGDVRYGAVHGSRTYLFATELAQKKFLADPKRFAPVLSACDPVVFAETSQLIDGNRNIGMLIGEKTFFFTSEETRRRFELSPQVYAAHAYKAMSAGQLRTR